MPLYFGPDADQDWRWISPGAVGATGLWLVASLIFKAYIANFTDYNDAYGAVGGVDRPVAVVLCIGRDAILAGAELNAEIEHASVYGKPPGQKNRRESVCSDVGPSVHFNTGKRQRSTPAQSACPPWSRLALRLRKGIAHPLSAHFMIHRPDRADSCGDGAVASSTTN